MAIQYETRNTDFYCRDTRKSNSILGCFPHLHYHVEMGIVISGRTRLMIDSTEYTAEAGDLFICFPNQVHSYETLSKEKYVLFVFNPDMIPEFSIQLISSIPKSNIIKNVADDKDILTLFYKISDAHAENGKYRDMIIRGYLLALFGKLFSKLELLDIKTRDIKTLGMILNYCTKNHDQPLTLSIIEKELHVSRFYISHTLSSKLHIGFNDYVNSLRISNACKYLLTTDLSITQVSEKVGFNTLRTFNRAFMKHMGTTPSAYRLQKSTFHSSSLPL